MSAEAAALTRSWPVGTRTATLSMPKPRPGRPQSCVILWTPDAPPSMSGAEWKQYRAGRDAAVSELAAALGVNVAVIDL